MTEGDTSSEDAKGSKPNPDIFEAALNELGNIARDKVIVIGDTIYDAEAAAKATVRAIGLTCGGSTAEQLRQAACVAIYRDPADLLVDYVASPLAHFSEPKVRKQRLPCSPAGVAFSEISTRASRRIRRRRKVRRVQLDVHHIRAGRRPAGKVRLQSPGSCLIRLQKIFLLL